MIIQSTTLDTEDKVIAVYGGTAWEKIEGRFLLGTSSSHTINSTGGAETVTLTVAQLPKHTPSLVKGGSSWAIYANANDPATPSNEGFVATDLGWYSGANKTISGFNSIGSSQAHNNMPPFKTVYIWERTE